MQLTRIAIPTSSLMAPARHSVCQKRATGSIVCSDPVASVILLPVKVSQRVLRFKLYLALEEPKRELKFGQSAHWPKRCFRNDAPSRLPVSYTHLTLPTKRIG